MKPNNGRFLLAPFRWRNAIYSQSFKFLFARKFAAYGRGCNILFPEGIEGAENIRLGSDVVIGAHSFLAARPVRDGGAAELTILDGTRIGRFNHIYSTRRVVIGKRVLTANNVYIADNSHRFDDPATPVFEQPLQQLAAVEIGDGTWIGHGACVVGARIGRNCVIGAGAFVRSDIPDYCVAVGSPARIVKRYDALMNRWRQTESNGAFRNGHVQKALK